MINPIGSIDDNQRFCCDKALLTQLCFILCEATVFKTFITNINVCKSFYFSKKQQWRQYAHVFCFDCMRFMLDCVGYLHSASVFTWAEFSCFKSHKTLKRNNTLWKHNSDVRCVQKAAVISSFKIKTGGVTIKYFLLSQLLLFVSLGSIINTRDWDQRR